MNSHQNYSLVVGRTFGTYIAMYVAQYPIDSRKTQQYIKGSSHACFMLMQPPR